MTLRADHPAGKTIDGAVTIWTDRDFALDDDGNQVGNVASRMRRITGNDDAFEIVVTLPDDRADPVNITAHARNLCGPSKVTVRLVPPAS